MCIRDSHRLPVSFVHAPVQPHDAVEVVFLLRTQVAHADVLVGVVAHEVAVTDVYKRQRYGRDTHRRVETAVAFLREGSDKLVDEILGIIKN